MPCRRREPKDTLGQARLEVFRSSMLGFPWHFGPRGGPGYQMPSHMQHSMMGRGMGMPMAHAMGAMGMCPQMQQRFTPPSEPQPPRISLTAKSDGSFDVVSVSKRPAMPDDDRKLSTSYTSLGLVWMHGEKRTTPKRFRASLCTACNDDEYPMVKVAQLDEEQVDLLLFVLAGILPSTRVSDMGAVTKGDAREAVRRQHQVKLRKNATRLSHLSEELDNLPMVAMRMGYPAELFSPPLKKAYDEMRSVRMGGVSSGSPSPCGNALAALGDAPKQLQIADGTITSDSEDTARVGVQAQPTKNLRTGDADLAHASASVIGVTLPKVKLPRTFAPALPKRQKVDVGLVPVEPRAIFRELEEGFEVEASKAGGAMPEEGKLVVAEGLSLSSAERQELETGLVPFGAGIDDDECEQCEMPRPVSKGMRRWAFLCGSTCWLCGSTHVVCDGERMGTIWAGAATWAMLPTEETCVLASLTAAFHIELSIRDAHGFGP